MTTTDPAPAPVLPALPTGTTVLEASAGTGKTHAVAGLATRYLAEGAARVEELLVVTFSRAATAQLRDRVRSRVLAVRDALADPAAAADHPDDLVRHLAAGSAEDVALRRARLDAALADVDAATVATVHQFCQQVLRSLGTAADVDPGATLVEDVSDLVEEVCDDLYVRSAVQRDARPLPFTRAEALRVAREAVDRAGTRLEPAGADPASPAGLRVRFALAVRREVDARKRARRLLSFDDLLGLLRDVLRDPVAGPVACERLRRRYSVVLVDEFQDTDAVQWQVLETAFHGVRPLVLVGDPKQAVYAFRGADVRSYLAAAAVAGGTETLGTNFRSDPLVVAGTAALLRGAALGEERIVVREVTADRAGPALRDATGAGDPAPVRLRVLRRDGLPTTRGGDPVVADVRARVAADVAEQVAAVLDEGLRLAPRDAPERDLCAGDVAVLVRTRAQADAVHDALRRWGVPCVLSRGPSVFATPAAAQWLVLLEALEQPHRAARVRRLALSPLVGRTAAALDAEGDAATDRLAGQVRRWGHVLADRGPAALHACVAEEHDLPRRLLGEEGGERLLTDLRHVAETLHAEVTAAGLGLAGSLAWLRARVAEAAGDADVERSRRLDTDRAAVQITTVHASKGLEHPVVCVPYAWDGGGGGTRDRLPVAHDDAPGGDGERVLHVGGPGSERYDELCARADAEDAGEELRLLYVALTRAVSRTLVWWAPATTTPRGALHRLVGAPDPRAVPDVVALPTDAAFRARLDALWGPDLAAHGLAVEQVPRDAADPRPRPAPAGEDGDLAVALPGPAPDTGWRRTSYSGLTRAVHEAPGHGGPAPAAGAGAGATDDTAGPGGDDEVDVAPAPAGDGPVPAAWRAVPSPMADLPAGADFGTLVHAVLERYDPAVADPDGTWTGQLAALARAELAGPLAEPLALALQPVLRTGLGPLAGGASLADVAAADRLNELDFELPLAGGDRPGAGTARPRLADVAALLRRHLPDGDPVRRYADLLDLPPLADEELRGYLTGSVDAVLRVADPAGGRPRFLVVDYKTNRLSAPGEALTAWHYRREALDDAVLAAHYPLQALLYCVALHRFLRWRVPDHDPDRDLGGVLYLFLRGMCGPGVEPAAPGEAPPGVWSWHPPAALVVALSDLLAGRPS